MLTKEDILKPRELPRERVAVPEWGGELYVRGMTGLQRDAWESGWADWRKKYNGGDENFECFNAYLLAHVLCDEAGKPILNADYDSVWALNQQPASALARLARVAMRLNGIGAAAEDEILKNFDGGPSGSPGSS